MARDYCRILTSIWGTEGFTQRSSGAQRLYFLILSQPEISMCGVLTPACTRWASFAPETTERTVKASLNELIKNDYILQDSDWDELWVRSFVRHDLKLGTPNVAVGMTKAFVGVRSPLVRSGIIQEIRKDFPVGFTQTFEKTIQDRFAKAFVDAEQKAFAHAA